MIIKLLATALAGIGILFAVSVYNWHKAEYLHERAFCGDVMGCLIMLSIPLSIGLFFALR